MWVLAIGMKLANILLIKSWGGIFCRSLTKKIGRRQRCLATQLSCQTMEEFNDMALVPLGDRILVKRSDNDEQTTSGGIIIPDTAKEKPQEGEVVAVGNGRLLDNGERQPVDVEAGDLVLFAKYGGTEVTYDNIEYLILREDDILAKVN